MKNKGCLLTFLVVVVALGALFGFSALAYSVFVSEEARQFSLFHSRTIVFQSVYTVVPSGAWFDRVVTISMFTGFIWFLVWIVLFALKKLTGNPGFTKRSAKGVFITMLTVLGWSLIATHFIPKRIVVYDEGERRVKVRDYQALFHIWPWPFSTESSEVAFEEVKDIRFVPYESHIMGTSHDEMELLLITETDTIVAGASMVYHGEFGWLMKRSSREEVVNSAKQEANQLATDLLKLIKEK